MDMDKELKFNNKLDFDIAKVYKNNDDNPIILYTNKYNIDLKTIKRFKIEVYISGLMFNFVFNIAIIIYIICNLNLFYSYETINIYVNENNINKLEVKYKGILILKINKNQLIYLNNIYYILELRINLLSINKLIDYSSIFVKNKALVNKDNKLIIYRTNQRNLYRVKFLIFKK